MLTRFALVLALPFILGADCKQVAVHTALDVAGCALKGVADAAAPLLGGVSELLFSDRDDEAVKGDLKALATAKGSAIVGCAIDRVVHDLGGAVVEAVGGTHPTTGRTIETAPRRAVRRALQARAELK